MTITKHLVLITLFSSSFVREGLIEKNDSLINEIVNTKISGVLGRLVLIKKE